MFGVSVLASSWVSFDDTHVRCRDVHPRYQHLRTTPGATYTIRYDVWASPLKNTAGKVYCSTTDSNGLMDITDGAAINLEQHGQKRLCPDHDGQWQTVAGPSFAWSYRATLR